MAPEQARGDLERVGPATDVYALGAVLHEMLVGRPPFRVRTPLETLARVLEDRVVALRPSRPDVPDGLEQVCLRCLEHEPERRYRSAQEALSDLRRVLTGMKPADRNAGTEDTILTELPRRVGAVVWHLVRRMVGRT
jgi:serine/threonine-protein kinase